MSKTTKKTREAEEVEEAEKTKEAEETEKVLECDLECHLCFETDCEDEVKMRGLLDGDLTIPVCEKHYKEHQVIIYLHRNGYDIEQILGESEDWRKKEALTVQFSIPGAGNIEDVTG